MRNWFEKRENDNLNNQTNYNWCIGRINVRVGSLARKTVQIEISFGLANVKLALTLTESISRILTNR